jgi:hypothetical protein
MDDPERDGKSKLEEPQQVVGPDDVGEEEEDEGVAEGWITLNNENLLNSYSAPNKILLERSSRGG